jgi:hypothetical protein
MPEPRPHAPLWHKGEVEVLKGTWRWERKGVLSTRGREVAPPPPPPPLPQKRTPSAGDGHGHPSQRHSYTAPHGYHRQGTRRARGQAGVTVRTSPIALKIYGPARCSPPCPVLRPPSPCTGCPMRDAGRHRHGAGRRTLGHTLSAACICSAVCSLFVRD